MGAVWRETLRLADVWHNDDLEWEQKRDVAVERIQKLRLFRLSEDTDEVRMIIEEMADCDDVDWFDQVWDAFYDWADWNRVWVATV